MKVQLDWPSVLHVAISRWLGKEYKTRLIFPVLYPSDFGSYILS